LNRLTGASNADERLERAYSRGTKRRRENQNERLKKRTLWKACHDKTGRKRGCRYGQKDEPTRDSAVWLREQSKPDNEDSYLIYKLVKPGRR